jgi:hypothetical protein
MSARTSDANIALTGGERDAAVRLQLSEVPFRGSALALAADGFAELIDATSKGQPFAGFAEARVLAKDHPAVPADGDIVLPTRRGLFFALCPIANVAQDDVAHQRAVFMADDGTFDFDPAGTLVGIVWELESAGNAIVLCATAGHHGALGLEFRGTKTLAATGGQTLTTADLGKLILMPNTAAHALTLPAAADCTGKKLVFKKTTAAAFAVTITGAGAETIDGANTFAACDAQYDTVTITSDGTAWHITGKMIA